MSAPSVDRRGAAESDLGLEAHARTLAAAQRDLERPSRRARRAFDPQRIAPRIEQAKRTFTTANAEDATLQSATGWFLDNYYLIRRVARQVEDDLPDAFVGHLPQLASGPLRGRPRVEALSRALVSERGTQLDLPTVLRFLHAYQQVSPLTIAELWALPTMLRAAVLARLVEEVEALSSSLGGAETVPSGPGDGEGAGVAWAVRALRVLEAIDWKAVFERTNRVEAVLRQDPAHVYARMDFETCDAYRKSVEALAWATRRDEDGVAQLAIDLAREADVGERARHVGYFLVAEGRRHLEARLGFRPRGVERLRRALLRWPTTAYLLPIAALTSAAVFVALFGLAQTLSSPDLPSLIVAALLALIPASTVAVTLTHAAMAHLLPPRTLPKLDFEVGLPAECRTLVAIPTLLGREDDVATMLRQIELHYLSNPDPALQFALLTDDVDTTARRDPSGDRELLESASQGIERLNERHGHDGSGPFHLLHREARWNGSEQRFMGWERKRGKLEELNRLLRGDSTTTYGRHVGDPDGLAGIRFVITLDSDTELPMGSARRLVGLLAHPLNRAVFEPETGRVVAGYTIVQPRIETSPSSARDTAFSRVFSGDIGFDIYTHACSEVYQDLFGSGIYVGKGIYDVDSFMRSVEGLVPENALVSHDLFEGIHGRTALATDIVLFEGYPRRYLTYALRMHRWVRGDWQLLPWLLSKVPWARAGTRYNKLSGIDRWKIADNLRRSLVAPSILTLLVLGWTWLPGGASFWTLAGLACLVGPSSIAAATSRRGRTENLARAGLAVVFLAYETWLVLDAIVRVVVRRAITQKHLLQWTSAAHTAHGVAGRDGATMYWRTMLASPLLGSGIAMAVGWLRPWALPVAAPLLLMWGLAPQIGYWISKPALRRVERVTPTERQRLRRLARRTWRFFDTFVGPNDQWLPIDNFQEAPHEQTAHRTSPTNIGLTLLATLSAHDFGYIGPSEFSLRVRRAFESIVRMEHYRGHLFNWYDTRNLQPLLPRYVSTVDSGNLAACLLALKQGCTEMLRSPVLRVEAWDGLRDSIDLLDDAVRSAPGAGAESLDSVIARMQAATSAGLECVGASYETLRTLCDHTASELDGELLAFLETGAHRHEPDLLRALRTAIDRLHQQLRQMRRELDTLQPWLALGEDAEALGLEIPPTLPLEAIPAAATRLRLELEASAARRQREGTASAALTESAQRIDAALRHAQQSAEALVGDLVNLAARAEHEVHAMDFGLLYDPERKLFHIGYNATNDELDRNYYDLLASEARLASYVAIIKRDVPASHWFALGRPLTSLRGTPALLSWGGTMFEYLMPDLLMQSRAGTLLARTNAAVLEAQIDYAQGSGAPWGISESAYAHVDAAQTYQYRSFGVPGLGFKRGLEDDRVVSPYASILAVSLRPRRVVDNVAALEAMGMLGTYGLFEALDLTPTRAGPSGTHAPPHTVVRAYMAHHQGMILVALGNALNPRSMVDRFHADGLVETGAALLNERPPLAAPSEWPTTGASRIADAGARPASSAAAPSSWAAPTDAGPQAFVLSNGRLSSVVTSAGGGGLRWQGLALTRDEPDASRVGDGTWLYLRDESTRRVWLATSLKGRTTYWMHKVGLHLRNEGISTQVEVTIAPSDDVEVRRVTLHNETGRARQLTLHSAARPVLQDAKQASLHPAFSSMFVQSERIADLDGLLFARRPRSSAEDPAVLAHILVSDGRAVVFGGHETDRGRFLGRGGSLDLPAALEGPVGPEPGRVGAVLDPIMSVAARIHLPPNGTVTLAFVTTVARSRRAALELARKYGSMHAVRWTFRDAERETTRRLQRTDLDPALLPAVQRLYAALRFVDARLRASASARALSPPRQGRLWGHGISGDDPIVLVRVEDPAAPLLLETFAAQRYLRSCGVSFDLVLVDDRSSGYATGGAGTLRHLLAANGLEHWRDRSGGVFPIAADQTPDSDIDHLEACAHVVLHTREQSLASSLRPRAAAPPKLPRFEGTLARTPEPPRRARPPLRFDNGTGGFTEDGREYVVDVQPGKPTPAPWCNVIANAQFGCLVSESALGTTWSLNSGENRLTPWRNDPVLDTPSEALYLRDEETAELWSPTPLPAGRDAATRVRHGAGYTSYERETHGLQQTMTVFVPPGASLKIVRLEVRNTTARHRRLTATYYAEWVLGSRRELQRAHVVSAFDRDHACLLATCSWNAAFEGRVAFLASQPEVHGYTADRAEFLGERGDDARPEGLERWGLSGRTDLGSDPCAALQIHLELGAGETLQTHFLLGQASSHADALAMVAKFRDPAAVEQAWGDLRRFWDDRLGCVRVQTPEPAMDLMLNRWLVYQTLSARLFARTGLYQSSGAIGYRDQLQDVLALLHAAPELARAHIVEAAKHQFEAGDVLHWWHPPSGRGVRTRCSDDMAWLPYVVGEYVTATGDAGLLEEPVSFLHGEPLRPEEHDRYAEYDTSPSTSSLFEHCRRALERGLTEGAHGLPRMGDGDWNDGMSRVGSQGRGESVWLGWFFCATIDRFVGLCTLRGEHALASDWRRRAEALRTRLDAVAWDGRWYLRAFHDDGSLVGSASSRECRIDSIAQSWAVLSHGDGDAHPLRASRARLAVHAAEVELVREAERLVLLFWPPFDSTPHDPGYIRAYPPGVRENGGQYSHAAAWLGLAHASLGDGAAAERIFRLLNPVLRARTAEDVARYRVEPYVLAADVYSCPPWVGRGGWTWYTGSAAWMWRLGTEAILGIRKEGGRLRIAPCIPPTWPGFEAWVRLGERHVHIVVENPDRVARGVAAATLDGVPIDEGCIELDPDTAGTHEVRLRLGPGTGLVEP